MRFRRAGIAIPATLMITLVLVAIDWTPLRTHHFEWLLTIAVVMVSVLWLGIAFVFLTLVFVAVALRVDRIELDEGRVRRRLIFGRLMEVPVEGALLVRLKGSDIVRGASTKRRLLVPHLFYAPEDLDRLWAAAGLTPADPEAPPAK
jgi:hypothetical protein